MNCKRKKSGRYIATCIGMAFAMTGVAAIENIPLGFSLIGIGAGIMALAQVRLPRFRIRMVVERR